MNKRKIKQLCTLFLVMMIAAAAIVQGAYADGSDWIVSDLMGSVNAYTPVDPKDDFHAYVNREWLSTAEIPDGEVNVSPFLYRELEVQEQIKLLMTDDSQTSHEARLVQTLYASSMNNIQEVVL